MLSIIVTAKTQYGKNALDQHFKEVKELSIIKRKMFESKLCKTEIINTEPYTVKFDIFNKQTMAVISIDKRIKIRAIETSKIEIVKMMAQNGAIAQKDYTFIISEG
jgi:hypothetical protein